MPFYKTAGTPWQGAEEGGRGRKWSDRLTQPQGRGRNSWIQMVDQRMGGTGPARSSFSQTCRLLSQYLKEKGSFGGLDLEMTPKALGPEARGKVLAPATMSLLPGMVDSPGEEHTESKLERIAPKSMDLFPRNSGFDPASSSKEEPGKPMDIEPAAKGQLTIFYGGKVLVFDDFLPHKAKQLMRMAREESIAAQSFTFSTPAPADSAVKSENLPSPAAQDGLSKANGSDMPIARRNSLHRFLEKRKDRISTLAPYQVHNSSASTSEVKPEPTQSWLNLGREASNPPGNSK